MPPQTVQWLKIKHLLTRFFKFLPTEQRGKHFLVT